MVNVIKLAYARQLLLREVRLVIRLVAKIYVVPVVGLNIFLTVNVMTVQLVNINK